MASSSIGNSEQIARKCHRKCDPPFLQRFVQERIQQTDRFEDFIATSDLFTEYRLSVERWTCGDSEREGHSLNKCMKETAFQKGILMHYLSQTHALVWRGTVVGCMAAFKKSSFTVCLHFPSYFSN